MAAALAQVAPEHAKLKISKSKLKQIIKEELENVSLEKEAPEEVPKTMETLLVALEGLLESWPACSEDPAGAACQYHKDLEEVVKEYGGPGCPEGSHGEEETVQEQ